MTAWIADLKDALERNERAVIVTVANTVGSTPREAGATMIVAQGGFRGTIGGGHLEFEALHIARGALAGDDARAAPWLVRFPLAARLGQCCGGVVTLAFTIMERGPHAWLDTAAACVRTSTPFALITAIGNAVDGSAMLLVTLDDAHGALVDGAHESAAIAAARTRLAAGANGAGIVGHASDQGLTLLIHIVRPDSFPVLVFGNGHVGRALVKVLGALPARVRWIDSRESEFPVSVPDNVEIVVTDAPEDEITHAPIGAFLVVLTHSHALDFRLVQAALERSDWRYVGLIGSAAKRAQFERRCASRGMAPDALARLVCPIGMSGGRAIRSKEPGAIAVAVAAELVGAREAAASQAGSGSAFHRGAGRQRIRDRGRP